MASNTQDPPQGDAPAPDRAGGNPPAAGSKPSTSAEGGDALKSKRAAGRGSATKRAGKAAADDVQPAKAARASADKKPRARAVPAGAAKARDADASAAKARAEGGDAPVSDVPGEPPAEKSAGGGAGPAKAARAQPSASTRTPRPPRGVAPPRKAGSVGRAVRSPRPTPARPAPQPSPAADAPAGDAAKAAAAAKSVRAKAPGARARSLTAPRTGEPKPARPGRSLAVRKLEAVDKLAAARAQATSSAAREDKGGWSPLAPFSAAAKASEGLLVRMRKEKAATAREIVRSIETGPKGPKIVAAFDFDGTLVGGFTGAMLFQERFRRKDVKFAEIADTAGVTFKAMARLLEANEVVAHSMAQWAGKSEEEMEELSSHLYENTIQDSVFPEMRQILDAHRAAGHTIVVATSASRYQVEPTVKSLGIDNLLCTQVEVADGKLTGKLVGDSLFGPGKVAAIERFVEANGSTLADTHFYADGDEEVGLMEAVGYPHPVNPSGKLTQVARARRWPVLRLESRGGTKPLHLVRSIAGLLSIMPILQAGVAVGLLTRDKRAMGNIVMPTWIQAQLDLAQVKLRVSGRKNLHARRPAVFIFNHRNNFDGSFVAALVRTDYVAIAKKDMANNPVGKFVSMMMPTVFIDRGKGGAREAAEALQPVVEAINDGYSVMLAPEGTRVRGNRDSVGEFKKGAFHIALAGGIPVVPVVIRNALDVASHSGGAMRPGTVDIAVLPPVSLEEWDRDNLDPHIAEVRQMFIDTLRDWPEPDPDD